jgi:8-amino-7-oxononanoate synthase
LLIDKLEASLAQRDARGLTRTRRVVQGKTAPQVLLDTYGATPASVLQFASNDYLGLASDPRVAAAAQRGIWQWGVGAGASHLVTGHTQAHEDLEREIAAFLSKTEPAGLIQSEQTEGLRALSFSSGYLANLAVLTALCDREAIIFADKLNHACLNDGALLSRAQFVRFSHNEVSALRTRLESTYGASKTATKLIAVDGVFSMDGDIAPLDEYHRLAQEFDAWLLVDDAHAFGVLGNGRGTAAHFGLRSDRIITMGTLGKAAGVAGAFVAAHASVIEWILNTARPYIYTTAQPALLAEAAREAVRIIADGEELRVRLRKNIAQFRAGCTDLPWTLLPSETAIQPLIVGSNDDTLALARALEAKGIVVPAIRPPTVPQGSARLRVSLSAAHSAPQVQQLLDALHEIARTQWPVKGNGRELTHDINV